MMGRSAGSNASYEAWQGTGPFEVTTAPLKVVAIIADRASPIGLGDTVTWQATTAGAEGSSIEYRFWRYNYATGSWTMRDYHSSPSWSWTTAPGDTGYHGVQVWARRQGSTAAWEAWAGMDTPFVVAGNVYPLTVTLLSDQGTPPEVSPNTPIT